MTTRVATGEVTQQRLDELALGKLNIKTGKRKGGFIEEQRNMRQNQEKLAIGEIGEDDLIEMAYARAWTWLKREADRTGANAVTDLDEEDAAYAAAQEARYRSDYDWDESNANDDAGLTMLIEYEVQARRLKRDLQRSNIPWKERVELLGELRQMGNTHANLQKSLQIDKATRDSRQRSEDPMEALRREIDSGARKMTELIDEWAAVAPTAATEEELRALMKHHVGLPYAWINATLSAHKRILGITTPSDSTGVAAEYSTESA